jgi:hypothetical protein
MEYIFEKWEKKLSDFKDNVESELSEIRKCKAEMQQMQLDLVAKIKKGHYVYDPECLVLSAPKIIIGHVDRNGTLLGGGSEVIIRGTQVGVQGAGEGGTVEVRASSIRHIAEDPGVDGLEHVVGTLSEIISQARNIIIQSNEVSNDKDSQGAFSATTVPTGSSGVRIHADKEIDIHAAMTAETRQKNLESLISGLEGLQSDLKDQADECKESFDELAGELKDLLAEREDLMEDNNGVRTNYLDISDKSEEIEDTAQLLTKQSYHYIEVLSKLAETNRRLKCFKNEKDSITTGDDFKGNRTGAKVRVLGEAINLVSADGEGNLRDNEGAGINMVANDVSIAAIESDDSLKEKGSVSIRAKNVEVSTANTADVQREKEGTLTAATYAAEGDFTLKSKNITIESVDYEVADSKKKEKQLTDDSKIKLRAKTIEVSTEGSANIEVDENGAITKANYTAEGDLIVKSKTVTVKSTDNDIENGEEKEKALTSESKVFIRAEKVDVVSTDTEGKATGSVSINAKAVSVKSMDTDKESGDDSALAEGSTMLLVSEKMYMGSKSDDVKSKKVQVVSEEIGAFADKTIEAQQGDGKAVVQLADGKSAVGGDETQVYGKTTINADTEVKGEVKAPKATIDDLNASTHFKTPNIEDGMAAGAGGGGGSLSTKLTKEDAGK